MKWEINFFTNIPCMDDPYKYSVGTVNAFTERRNYWNKLPSHILVKIWWPVTTGSQLLQSRVTIVILTLPVVHPPAVGHWRWPWNGSDINTPYVLSFYGSLTDHVKYLHASFGIRNTGFSAEIITFVDDHMEDQYITWLVLQIQRFLWKEK